MWVLWTQRLRRSSEEFWSLTYREIYACIDDFLDERQADQRGWNVRVGTVCATIRNSNPFSISKKVWEWTDFFQDSSHAPVLPAGKKKLSIATKIGLQQLAAYWHAKREKGTRPATEG